MVTVLVATDMLKMGKMESESGVERIVGIVVSRFPASLTHVGGWSMMPSAANPVLTEGQAGWFLCSSLFVPISAWAGKREFHPNREVR